MIRNIIITGLVILSACNSNTKKETSHSVDKTVNDSIPPKGPAVEIIDIENFGPIKLGQHSGKTLEALGQPDSKSKPVEWGADGLFHEDWKWNEYGLVINMSFDKTKIDSTLSVFSITATVPCEFKTKAGVGIGSSYAAVESAYKNDIDPYTTNKNYITVGDLYGGIFFTFKDDKAVKVFLGAAAE